LQKINYRQERVVSFLPQKRNKGYDFRAPMGHEDLLQKFSNFIQPSLRVLGEATDEEKSGLHMRSWEAILNKEFFEAYLKSS
jgi:hypothetical protein